LRGKTAFFLSHQTRKQKKDELKTPSKHLRLCPTTWKKERVDRKDILKWINDAVTVGFGVV
jgi:hypothetical protein